MDPWEVKLLRNPKLVTWEAGVSTASAKVCTIANGGMIAAISNSLYHMTQTSVAPTKITFSGAVTNLIGAQTGTTTTLRLARLYISATGSVHPLSLPTCRPG